MSEPPRQSRLLTADDRRRRPAPVWAIDELIPEWGVGQIYGPSYEGKTFVALDLALSVANETVQSWMGGRINRHGPVVYVLMEGAFDFGQRIEAWLLDHDGSEDRLLLTLEEEEVNLANPESLRMLWDDIRLAEIEPALVIVDTQALATPGVDENSNTEMGLVLANLKQMAGGLRCPVFTVAHTGLSTDTRARGASAVRAALDVEIRVNEGKVTFTKIKAAAPPPPRSFHLRPSGQSVWAASGASISQQAEAYSDNYSKVADVIRKHPFELSRNAVAERTGVRRSTVLALIRDMIEDRDVIEGRGGKLAWKDSMDPVPA